MAKQIFNIDEAVSFNDMLAILIFGFMGFVILGAICYLIWDGFLAEMIEECFDKFVSGANTVFELNKPTQKKTLTDVFDDVSPLIEKQRTSNGAKQRQSKASFKEVIYLDVSENCYGAYFQNSGSYFCRGFPPLIGPWKIEQINNDGKYMAAMLGVMDYVKLNRNLVSVIIKCDNESVYNVITKGVSLDKFMHQCLKEYRDIKLNSNAFINVELIDKKENLISKSVALWEANPVSHEDAIKEATGGAAKRNISDQIDVGTLLTNSAWNSNKLKAN
ncbi:unnamed protein product [Owenia fusiformis]|uniref:Uncharacterized protein n=1 Tax=Owenia fusiformis TaxID=6347 RepID=A0A8S4NQ18_OWEFU|nr:unnamed protein product [Owenia fusiformis]